MFRIDEYEVIDATARGNQARFVNHSCEPNCISKVIVVQGVRHIVIFAQRFIHRGEELTYDYKFPKEDDKIHCLCKSNRCRKYLN
jgi:SET domain-containing protein